MSRKCVLLLLLLSLSGMSRSLAGQGDSARQSRVALMVVINDGLDAHSSIIKRFAGPEPSDVIMLGPQASATELSEALRGLLLTRQISGDFPTVNRTFRLRPQQPASSRRDFPWAARVLADLSKAPIQSVSGIGRVRAVKIWLPAQRQIRK